jgi:hypothetical protein
VAGHVEQQITSGVYTMPTYNFITYDVWGNEDDGWDINDAYTTAVQMEIDDDTTDDDILECISDTPWRIEIDHAMCSEYFIYIKMADSDRPVGEFRLVRD